MTPKAQKSRRRHRGPGAVQSAHCAGRLVQACFSQHLIVTQASRECSHTFVALPAARSIRILA